jgi:hypothetical protein
MHAFSGWFPDLVTLQKLCFTSRLSRVSRQAGYGMRLGSTLALLLLTGGTLPAMAQADCQPPIAPVAPDGRASTQAQMMAAVTDAKNFIAQSDVYQQCLLSYVQAQKDLAAKDKTPFDKFIESEAMKKVNQNQADKQKVGSEINGAVAVYKQSHPN